MGPTPIGGGDAPGRRGRSGLAFPGATDRRDAGDEEGAILTTADDARLLTASVTYSGDGTVDLEVAGEVVPLVGDSVRALRRQVLGIVTERAEQADKAVLLTATEPTGSGRMLVRSNGVVEAVGMWKLVGDSAAPAPRAGRKSVRVIEDDEAVAPEEAPTARGTASQPPRSGAPDAPRRTVAAGRLTPDHILGRIDSAERAAADRAAAEAAVEEATARAREAARRAEEQRAAEHAARKRREAEVRAEAERLLAEERRAEEQRAAADRAEAERRAEGERLEREARQEAEARRETERALVEAERVPAEERRAAADRAARLDVGRAESGRVDAERRAREGADRADAERHALEDAKRRPDVERAEASRIAERARRGVENARRGAENARRAVAEQLPAETPIAAPAPASPSDRAVQLPSLEQVARELLADAGPDRASDFRTAFSAPGMPATSGARGALAHVGILLPASRAERERRRDLDTVGRGWTGSRTVVVIGGTAGAGATTVTSLLAAAAGPVRGGGVLVWDLAGTGLHPSTTLPPTASTHRRFAAAAALVRPDARVEAHSEDAYAVLRGAAASVPELLDAARPEFPLVLVDAGSADRDGVPPRAVDAADRLVVVSGTDPDGVAGTRALLRHLAQTPRGTALAADALVVVPTTSRRGTAAVRRTIAALEPLAGGLLPLPYDAALRTATIRSTALDADTRRAALTLTAALVELFGR